MKWTRLLRVVTALTTIFIAGAAAFAFRFRRDALIPRPPQHEFGARVTNREDGQITLTGASSRPSVQHPGTIGLWWAGGYGQVSEIVASGEDTATRIYDHLSGSEPPVGSLVDLEGYAFPSDPSDVGLEFTEVTFNGPLGALGAWVVPTPNATIWAIHIHGWSAERREAVRMLPSYHRVGITSMLIDYRNDPGAPADPSGHYQFGLTEWEDVEAAVSFATAHGAERVILSGFSTGAAAAMAFMERSTRADNVSGLVLDSPNIEMTRIVRTEAERLRVPRAVTALAMFMAEALWNVDWDGIDYVTRADRLDVPVLVFHGRADDRIPIGVSRHLKSLNPSGVDLVELPNAAHVMSWNVDPSGYESKLEDFLRNL